MVGDDVPVTRPQVWDPGAWCTDGANGPLQAEPGRRQRVGGLRVCLDDEVEGVAIDPCGQTHIGRVRCRDQRTAEQWFAAPRNPDGRAVDHDIDGT